MKLFDGGRAPNPRRVRIFLAEKGIEVPTVPVDMGALAHKGEEIVSRNPLKQLPVLELDDGTILTETIAICRYFEALHPEPSLFGRTPVEIATIEMWQRRLEFHLYGTIGAAFRHLHPAMAGWEMPQIPEWGEANKPKALEFMMVVDEQLSKSEFIAGDTYSVADVTGLVALDFAKPARVTIPANLTHLNRWYDALKARPSATA